MKSNVFNHRLLACVLGCAATLAIAPLRLQALPISAAAAAAQSPPAPAAPAQPLPAHLTPEQMRDLVAPIALYPDALVAQILAASAYPTQIVEADRFLQQNPHLKGAALAAEVDKQDWDPSVKALTQFPSVLANMDKNLTWTSELGDANVNQQADVMDAIQFLRQKAKAAGHLRTTPQEIVTAQGSTIIIQPANPQFVYVPTYDPEVIYGYPVVLWPGFYPWWGFGGPYMSFGLGFGIGPFFGFGWGWPAWGVNWYHRGLLYGGGFYGYRNPAFYNRNAYFHGNYHAFAPFGGASRSFRGYAAPAGRSYAGVGHPAVHLGAVGGIARGSEVRGYSSRGRASFGSSRGGMGGGMRGGGGGGMHGGGRR
jgi:uncharacterized membrane protein YgcG